MADQTLSTRIDDEIKAAMKARDQVTLATLRMLKTALTNRSIEKGRALEGAEELQVVGSLVKQRHDSVEQFNAGGRPELAARETEEIAVLERYLPPAASAEDIAAAVAAAVSETGATTPKDMGKVMKAVMPKLAGKTADGRAVSDAVRRALGAA
jgi:uncharacterized protein YqeY